MTTFETYRTTFHPHRWGYLLRCEGRVIANVVGYAAKVEAEKAGQEACSK